MKDERSPRIEFSTRFNKRREKVSAEIKVLIREALELFIENPNHPQLRNHTLSGKYSGYSSINITDDYRALFKIRKTRKETITIFHTFGTHEQLYGEN